MIKNAENNFFIEKNKKYRKYPALRHHTRTHLCNYNVSVKGLSLKLENFKVCVMRCNHSIYTVVTLRYTDFEILVSSSGIGSVFALL